MCHVCVLFLFAEILVRYRAHAVSVAVLLPCPLVGSAINSSISREKRFLIVFVTSNLRHLDNLHTLSPFEN